MLPPWGYSIVPDLISWINLGKRNKQVNGVEEGFMNKVPLKLGLNGPVDMTC